MNPPKLNPILARPRISPLAAMRAPRPQLDFVLPGLLAGTTGLIVAPGATGKSWISLQIAASVASGLPICNGAWNAPQSTGHVLVLGWEDPQIILQDRLHIYMSYLRDAGVGDEMLEAIDERVDVRSMHGDTSLLIDADGGPGDLLPALIEAAQGYRLVILDPLARLHSGDENLNGYMTRLVAYLESVAHDTGSTVIVVHHASKAAVQTGGGADQQAARGASALARIFHE